MVGSVKLERQVQDLLRQILRSEATSKLRVLLAEVQAEAGSVKLERQKK